MSQIKDSGETRKFATGSQRDVAEGKGRCDLLPEISVLRVFEHVDKKDSRISAAAKNTVESHMEEAVKSIMRYKRDIDNVDWLYHAATEALIAVGIDEGCEFGVDKDNEISCLSIGLMRTAIHYEEGAKKYGENNWKLGQPLHVLLDSGIRHSLKGMANVCDEPHLRAAAWNFLGAIWTIECAPEMSDIPKSGDVS